MALGLIFGVLAVIPVCSTVVAQDVVNTPLADPYSDTRPDVHIGVLGLFRPRQLTVSAASGSALVLYAGDESITLEKSSGIDSATVRISGNHVAISAGERAMRASSITVPSR